MYLRQPGFTYNDCEHFTENKERVDRFKETRHLKYIFQNELDKTCFQHGMAYGGFKYLPRRTIADKILLDKDF